MKKQYLIFFVILILSTLLVLTGCDKAQDTTQGAMTTAKPTTTAAVTTADPTENMLVITEDFQITRPDSAKNYESDAAKLIKAAIKDATGMNLKVATDWLKPGASAPEYEILIANADRSFSKELSASLKENEWCVAVLGTKIVIAGNTARALTDATNYFIENYVEGKSKITVENNAVHAETNKFVAVSWEDAETIKVTSSGSYPRLYQLRDGTLLCGIDNKCFISNDDGSTWSTGYTYGVNTNVGSFRLAVANSAFHELEDGTILVAYRATGYIAPKQARFCTRIQVSQSKDGGKTWTYHSLIAEHIDENGESNGYWEPHFGLIDGVLTCFYANDGLNYEKSYQHIEFRQWINGKWSEPTIASNGIDHKSRDGMPVWQQLSTGKYVLAIEGWVPDGYALCIQLLYSDDGYNWSEPVIVYRAKNGACGAPYVVELPTGQLLVSFQTDENFEGDERLGECRMMCMISDGTPVEYITAANFSPIENVFNTPAGSHSLWNGLYVSDKYLYACTGTNAGLKGILIKRISLEELLGNTGK